MKSTSLSKFGPVNKNFLRVGAAVMTGIFLQSLAPNVQGATIMSDNITWGMGFVEQSLNVGQWDTSETSSVNVGPGSGFSFSMAAASPGFSTGGPSFNNAVLGAYSTSNWSSAVGPTLPLITIDVNYTGPTPADAAPLPNYRLQLVITNISVFAAAVYADTNTTINWNETTVGNTQSSTPISMNRPTPALPFVDYTAYAPVAWNPVGFESAGLSQGRTFTLQQSVVDSIVIDGMQFTGNVILTYDAVPEPGTVALFTVVGLGLVIVSRRKGIRRLAS